MQRHMWGYPVLFMRGYEVAISSSQHHGPEETACWFKETSSFVTDHERAVRVSALQQER